MMTRILPKLSLVLFLGALAAALGGCPPTGVICSEGLDPCGTGCADFQSDRHNCGTCGHGCQVGQVCQTGSCVCQWGSTACDGECVATGSDPRNCGSCGHACQPGQECRSSKCECQAGATACGGECVVTASDPLHCGDCDTACVANQVCEGTCKTSCSLGTSTQCGLSCVNLTLDPRNCGSCGHVCPSGQVCQSSNCECPSGTTACGGGCVKLAQDPNHCGACDRACENAQSCHGGFCSYDVVAACMSNGQLTGLQAGSFFKGPAEALGTGPSALAAVKDVLLVADGIDKKLYQARLTSEGGHAFAQHPGAVPTGDAPNQVLVDDPYVYVVNAAGGTLQVLLRAGELPDGGTPDAGGGDGGIELPPDGGFFPLGLQLTTVGELSFGPNSFPEGMAKLGNFLYVPLYGGYGAAAAAVGQKVVKVDISNPRLPVSAGTIDLSTLDLQPFDGGAPVARPYAIAEHQGRLYVALNNLNPDTYAPEGPGLLARIEPSTTPPTVSTVNLGDGCLNPVWVMSDGVRLYVSCQGKANYNTSWAVDSVEKTGVVALEQDLPSSTWAAACLPDAGAYQADGGGGCLPVIAGRMALQGGQVYVGDQIGGRVFVLDRDGGQLIERRGYGAVAAPIQACAVDPAVGFSNVSDLLTVP
ncbi:MAG: MXAN_6577-like cysteine-rich protein [Myxococcaceae bacterium]